MKSSVGTDVYSRYPEKIHKAHWAWKTDISCRTRYLTAGNPLKEKFSNTVSDFNLDNVNKSTDLNL